MSDLQRLDERLRGLAEKIAPGPYQVLPAELRSGAECVRSDLLGDAISTLSALAVQTEEGALQRRIEIADAVERIAAYG